MKKSPFFVKLGIALSIGCAVLLFLVYANFFNSLDPMITQYLQKIIPRFLDLPFSLFSVMGSFEIVLLILLILWAIRRELNHFIVLFFFGLFHVFEFMGKLFINHPGPTSEFFRYDIPFSLPSSGINTGFSFPSGHMGRTVFISVILLSIIYNSKKLSKVQKRLLYCLIVIIVGLMFISRIYLGEHWLSDVIGGSLLGATFGIFSYVFLF